MTETAERLGRLEVRVEGDAASRRIALRGKIDEMSPISDRVDAWAAREVIVDTAEVVFINSIGVREWMRLIRGLTGRGAKVRLDRCAEVIIEQINMIDEAKGGAEVISFHAPYQCSSCGLEASMLIDVVSHAATMRRMEAPAMSCPDCNRPMELYETPEKFFSFLTV